MVGMVGGMNMQSPHNFQAQLSFSEKASDESFWDKVYRKAFPGLVNHMTGYGDFASQRMGVDRCILLSNGRVLKIDEKKRRRVFSDILLEYLSSDSTNSPGWIEKNLVIDYVAYAFMPTQQVYLLDWLTLRRAWTTNKNIWQRIYKPIYAINEGYKTWSTPVPIPVLQRALWEASSISLIEIDLRKVA